VTNLISRATQPSIGLLTALMLAVATPAQAQFWKKALQIAVNPIGFAHQQVAQAVVPGRAGQVLGIVANPTGAVTDQVPQVVSTLAQEGARYVGAASRQGLWGLMNAPNPWLIQSVYAIKGLRSTGVITSEAQCRQIAGQIAQGAAVGAASESGSAEVTRFIQWATQNMGDTACGTAYTMTVQTSTGAVQQPVAPGTPGAVPQPYGYTAPAVPYPIGRCFFPTQPADQWAVMSNGQLLRSIGGGPWFVAGQFMHDPWGRFFSFIQEIGGPGRTFGVDWNGLVWTSNAYGQPYVWGQCS
jgi:hypothetical protein